MGQTDNVASMTDEKFLQNFSHRYKGMRPVGKLRYGLGYYIRMDLKAVGYG